jgi:hypothetical protein
MTDTINTNLEKKTIIVCEKDCTITVKNPKLLKELIYDLESKNRKFFVVEV